MVGERLAGATPDYAEIDVSDSDGRETYLYVDLTNTFVGFGGFTGYADRIELDAANLVDDGGVDGGPFIDIAYISIYLGDLVNGGPSSEFGIDNLDIDGGGSNDSGEVFPSGNGATIDFTDSYILYSILRGTGDFEAGIEVTNGTANDTTFSTVLEPGGDLADNGQADHIPILAGQTQWSGYIVALDRSLPSADYSSEITVVNDGDPSDPDNTFGFEFKGLVEAPA